MARRFDDIVWPPKVALAYFASPKVDVQSSTGESFNDSEGQFSSDEDYDTTNEEYDSEDLDGISRNNHELVENSEHSREGAISASSEDGNEI